MRTSEQIFHQIRWDPRFTAAHYFLGIHIRGGQSKEIPLLSFQPGGDIPWHRIHWIRGPRGIVWDRHQGIDELRPESEPSTWSWPLSIFSWNCCASAHGLPLRPRLLGLQAALHPAPADLVALQEVGEELARHLPQGPYCYRSGDLYLALQHPPQRLLEIPLSQGKTALLADLGCLRVANLHLTSDYRPGGERKRRAQWEELRPHLGPGPWLVVGDFNASDEEVCEWGIDLTPPQPSFDPSQNPWARQTSRSGVSARYQRVLSQGLSGRVEVTALGLSDHEPLQGRLTLAPALSTTSAWAVLPPPRLTPQIDSIRRQHDPAFSRWMPHINLWYPAPDDPDYDEIRQNLASSPQFALRLASLQRFPQGVLYWGPDATGIQDLREIRRRLGGIGAYQPHLTLAQSRVDFRPEGCWDCTFEVDHVVHLRRHNGRMEIAQAIPLRPRHPLYASLQAPGGPDPVVVGSSCFLEGTDLDAVTRKAVAPPQARRVGHLWRGPGYDLHQTQSDPPHPQDPAWRAVLDRDALWTWLARQRRLPAFREELQQLHRWLNQRGIKGQAWGWPGGLAWAVLLAVWGWGHFREKAALWDFQLALEPPLPPSRHPMSIWSPSLPLSNLTAHVPQEFLPWLREEFQGNPPAWSHFLEIQGDPQGAGLGLVIDFHRQLGLAVRPWVRDSICTLCWQGDFPVQEAMRFARGRLPQDLPMREVSAIAESLARSDPPPPLPVPDSGQDRPSPPPMP